MPVFAPHHGGETTGIDSVWNEENITSLSPYVLVADMTIRKMHAANTKKN